MTGLAFGETVFMFGQVAIVVHPNGALKDIYVATDVNSRGRSLKVISTRDPDAGTWYIDEPTCAWAGLKQCVNCSRFGHRRCENRGVMVDPAHFERRRKARAWLQSARALAARQVDTKRRRRIVGQIPVPSPSPP